VRISSDHRFAAIDARTLRGLLRRFADGITPARFADEAGLDEDETVATLTLLETDGWLEYDACSSISFSYDEMREQRLCDRLGHQRRSETGPGRGLGYRATLRGYGLCNASFARPVTAATAQRHLDAFLDRVAQVNADPHAPHVVTEVVLFGSFARGTDDRFGDVDIALRLERRVADPQRWGDQDETYRQLKAGSRVVSLHDLDFHRKLIACAPSVTLLTVDRDGLPGADRAEELARQQAAQARAFQALFAPSRRLAA